MSRQTDVADIIFITLLARGTGGICTSERTWKGNVLKFVCMCVKCKYAFPPAMQRPTSLHEQVLKHGPAKKSSNHESYVGREVDVAKTGKISSSNNTASVANPPGDDDDDDPVFSEVLPDWHDRHRPAPSKVLALSF